MSATLWKRADCDILLQFGFRRATTVASEFLPRQDVRDDKPFYDDPMLGVVHRYVRDRLLARTELIPVGFSWTFVLLVDSTLILLVLSSTAQRASREDLPAALIATVIAISPLVLFFALAIKFSPGLTWTTSYTAVIIWLFATSTPIRSDVAPILMALMLGVVGALAPVVYSVLALGSAVGLLAVASVTHRLDELTLYVSCAAMGWLVGALMRIQAQLLVKQQELQADLAAHAAADERRRIAREVHDVIAHSLSVTMLHVTGARRALQQDADIDDAVAALIDAERLGRQAMADIRHTVGLLEAGPTKMAPEPGIADIPALVEDFVSAGLPVTLHNEGRQERVSAAVGLALYRIAQESLANIAKHAAASKTDVALSVSSSHASLSVVNDIPVTVPATSSSQCGRGLPGMRQRVELLGGILDAGPCEQGWSVRAEIPINDNDANSWRCGR